MSYVERQFSIILALLLFPLLPYAQRTLEFSTQLEWPAFTGQSQDMREKVFEHALLDANKADLPLFNQTFLLQQKSSDANIELTNLVFETLPNSWLSDSQKKHVPTRWQYRASIKTGRTDDYCSVNVNPIRFNSVAGVYERLLSFDASVAIIQGSKRPARAGFFVDNSELAEGTWYKIAIGEDGVYKLDYNLLQELGVEFPIDPGNINLYGNGGNMLPFKNWEPRHDDLQRNAISMVDGNDGSFDENDYILFYGKGPHRWEYDEDVEPERYRHVHHVYSDSAYYYIRVDDDETPKRISTANEPGGTVTNTVTTFDDRQFIENETSNLVKSGREFYGEHFDITTSYSFTFNTSNPIADTAYLHANLASRSSGGASSFDIAVAGTTTNLSIPAVGSSSTSAVAKVDDALISFVPSSSATVVTINFNKFTPNAEGWLDFLELNLERSLKIVGSQMHFRNKAAVGPGNVAEYILTESGFVNEVWDITDITGVRRVDLNMDGSDLTFKATADSLREFVAFAGSGYLEPRAVGSLSNQNLHALANVDMVILSSPQLLSESAQLEVFHEEEGMNVEVVTPQIVYNEFSSGNPDVTAIKMLMKMLHDKADGDEELMPKYLLIMGDGNYISNRGLNAAAGHTVITYQSLNSLSPTDSFVSDDYFAFLNDDESESYDDKLDIGVGRIPAETNQEAQDYINKVMIYSSDNTALDGGAFCLGDENPSPYGAWRNIITFVADDQDGNGGPTEKIHMEHSDEHSNTIFEDYNDYNVTKIYLDAYQQESTPGGERYPEAKEAIKQRVENGALIVNYIGHGGEKGWAHERVLDISTIQNWTNINRLPLFMTATCELARFDDPEFKSAGENIVMNPNGGAIAMLTTTRIVFSGSNQWLGRAFYKIALEDDEDIRLGDIARFTKNDDDVPNSSNKRNFTLLGDPAVRLAYPKHEVYTTHVNGEKLSEDLDTIGSLELVTLQGYVGNAQGNILDGFNGFVYPTVYDKKSDIDVLNNDGGSEFSFDMFRSTIYKGKASVENGLFEFSFIVPKDINFNVGNGRVSYYAVSGSDDAHGHSEEFLIGGSSDDVVLNEEGPEVNVFLNDTTFVFGGITSEDPILIARVFDENGINTVGNGIGHDITATLDGQTNSQIILNEYYESDLDTYQSGEIRYQLSSLDEGVHTLDVKVWDVQNNSSEGFTEFVVSQSSEMALDHVLNYPNPFTTRTEFFFEHNQACDALDVQIQVFTVSGKLVKTINRIVQSQGFRSEGIVWDGKDDFGDKIGRGVYVYRVKVETPTGTKAEEFETLVILN